MSVITITISIDVPDGARVSVSSGGAAKGAAKTRAPSGEHIPPGGSTHQLPGKKGQAGLTVGQAEMSDLLWWEAKIAKDLNSDPNSRFADKNAEDLEALRSEIERRTGNAPQNFSHDGGHADDDLPF